ncbi:hypothetical protein LTS10_013118 [Elasticomyces elasticus]|nr:hypothetical protein LTS10_013118 [Elasticomyces elasticus]
MSQAKSTDALLMELMAQGLQSEQPQGQRDLINQLSQTATRERTTTKAENKRLGSELAAARKEIAGFRGTLGKPASTQPITAATVKQERDILPRRLTPSTKRHFTEEEPAASLQSADTESAVNGVLDRHRARIEQFREQERSPLLGYRSPPYQTRQAASSVRLLLQRGQASLRW